MKFKVILFFITFSCGFSEDLKDLNTTELLKLAQDISQILPLDPNPRGIQFYLLVNPESDSLLLKSDNIDLIDLEENTKIIIHGWLENHKRSWYKNIADKYLKLNNISIIEVDWGTFARQPYLYSAKNAKYIGEVIAHFIETCRLPYEKVHLIGHSLGAHIAGFAGKEIYKRTLQKLARISGLDPAGPYFRDSFISPNERLDKSDAEIVDVIHTDAGFYGYENPIGTLDIYVNRGTRIQPGCFGELVPEFLGSIIETSFCSHARSTKYFAEWINIGKFNCRFCDSLLNYNIITDRCTIPQGNMTFGSEEINSNITGICFATTNRYEPFLN